MAFQCCYKDVPPTYAHVNSEQSTSSGSFQERHSLLLPQNFFSWKRRDGEFTHRPSLKLERVVLTPGRSCRVERSGSKDSAFRLLEGKGNSKERKDTRNPLDKVRTRGRSSNPICTATPYQNQLVLLKRPLHLQRTLLVGRLFRSASYSPSPPG